MDRGWIRVYRKSIESRVFQNEGLFKVWMWCLLKANHETKWVGVKTGRGVTEVKVEPGQFIFGRKKAAKELKMAPSTVQDRIRKLEKLQNLVTQPVTHYSIISIINWDAYQGASGNSDTQSDNQPTTNRHKQELKEYISPEKFSHLRKRYTNQKLIDQAFDAIRSTRKTGKVSPSVLLAQLQKWKRYPVKQVEAGIRVYLEKDCAGDGRDERYLLGIIRNQKMVEERKSSLSTWWDKIPG